ncbi:MAG: universal stress protein [Bacteroidales bacterium]|nr:universal stress protein [Bacteroidales bacterium]
MKKVLILTDFTQACYDSVTYALDFCRYYGLGAEILHVDEGDDDLVDDYERRRIVELVMLYRGKMQNSVEIMIKRGAFADVMGELSRSGKFNMIIMGTHGRHGFQSLTGSAAARIIVLQDIPVVVVQTKRFSPVKLALLPIADNIEQYSDEITKMAKLASQLGIDVKVVCRRGEEAFADTVSQLFGRRIQVALSIDYCKDRTFSLQAIEYGEKIGADMFLGFSHEIERPMFAPMLEQLIFNLSLIPVMCC